MRLVVRASGEKERGRRAGRRAIAKSERPEAVDDYQRIIWIFHEAKELVGKAVEGGDPAAAEIADEDGVAELAEITRSPDDSPRRVEPGTVFEVPDMLARGSENFNIAIAIASNIIVT